MHDDIDFSDTLEIENSELGDNISSEQHDVSEDFNSFDDNEDGFNDTNCDSINLSYFKNERGEYYPINDFIFDDKQLDKEKDELFRQLDNLAEEDIKRTMYAFRCLSKAETAKVKNRFKEALWWIQEAMSDNGLITQTLLYFYINTLSSHVSEKFDAEEIETFVAFVNKNAKKIIECGPFVALKITSVIILYKRYDKCDEYLNSLRKEVDDESFKDKLKEGSKGEALLYMSYLQYIGLHSIFGKGEDDQSKEDLAKAKSELEKMWDGYKNYRDCKIKKDERFRHYSLAQKFLNKINNAESAKDTQKNFTVFKNICEHYVMKNNETGEIDKNLKKSIKYSLDLIKHYESLVKQNKVNDDEYNACDRHAVICFVVQCYRDRINLQKETYEEKLQKDDNASAECQKRIKEFKENILTLLDKEDIRSIRQEILFPLGEYLFDCELYEKCIEISESFIEQAVGSYVKKVKASFHVAICHKKLSEDLSKTEEERENYLKSAVNAAKKAKNIAHNLYEKYDDLRKSIDKLYNSLGESVIKYRKDLDAIQSRIDSKSPDAGKELIDYIINNPMDISYFSDDMISKIDKIIRRYATIEDFEIISKKLNLIDFTANKIIEDLIFDFNIMKSCPLTEFVVRNQDKDIDKYKSDYRYYLMAAKPSDLNTEQKSNLIYKLLGCSSYANRTSTEIMNLLKTLFCDEKNLGDLAFEDLKRLVKISLLSKNSEILSNLLKPISKCMDKDSDIFDINVIFMKSRLYYQIARHFMNLDMLEEAVVYINKVLNILPTQYYLMERERIVSLLGEKGKVYQRKKRIDDYMKYMKNCMKYNNGEKGKIEIYINKKGGIDDYRDNSVTEIAYFFDTLNNWEYARYQIDIKDLIDTADKAGVNTEVTEKWSISLEKAITLENKTNALTSEMIAKEKTWADNDLQRDSAKTNNWGGAANNDWLLMIIIYHLKRNNIDDLRDTINKFIKGFKDIKFYYWYKSQRKYLNMNFYDYLYLQLTKIDTYADNFTSDELREFFDVLIDALPEPNGPKDLYLQSIAKSLIYNFIGKRSSVDWDKACKYYKSIQEKITNRTYVLPLGYQKVWIEPNEIKKKLYSPARNKKSENEHFHTPLEASGFFKNFNEPTLLKLLYHSWTIEQNNIVVNRDNHYTRYKLFSELEKLAEEIRQNNRLPKYITNMIPDYINSAPDTDGKPRGWTDMDGNVHKESLCHLLKNNPHFKLELNQNSGKDVLSPIELRNAVRIDGTKDFEKNVIDKVKAKVEEGQFQYVNMEFLGSKSNINFYCCVGILREAIYKIVSDINQRATKEGNIANVEISHRSDGIVNIITVTHKNTVVGSFPDKFSDKIKAGGGELSIIRNLLRDICDYSVESYWRKSEGEEPRLIRFNLLTVKDDFQDEDISKSDTKKEEFKHILKFY